MTVIRITEECHGFIGIAKDEKSAQNYVIDFWLKDNSDVYVDDKDQTLEEVFGKNWKEVLKEMPFDEFEELMNGLFWFSNEEVIGSEDE